MVFTRKFSQFPNGGPIANGDQPVGLEAGVNTIWEFAGGGGGGGAVVTIIDQDTSALAVGRWVRFDLTTNLYVQGIATSAEFAEIEGVVLNILGPNQFSLQQSGYIGPGTPGFAGFTPGIYYLSATGAGLQSLAVPVTNGYVNKPLFAADSADSGWVICLMRGFIVGTPGPIPANPPGGNDTSIHQVSQPGNTFQTGDWVTVSGDNTYALSDSATLAGAQGVGVVIAQGDPLFTIQFSGWNTATVVRAVDAAGNPLVGGIVASTVYYISNMSPGDITPFPPANIGTANKPAFISASTLDGTGWVLPQRPILNTTAETNPILTVVTQAGHGFQVGQVLKVLASNVYALAQANNAANALPVGFVVQVIDANTFVLQSEGYSAAFVFPFPPLTPANRYFLSPTIAGGITLIEPASPNYSVPMLIALNPTTGYILSQRPLQNSAGTIVPLILGGTQTPLVAPGADSLFAWNFAAGQAEFLGIGAGLAIVGGNLTAPGGGGTGVIQTAFQNYNTVSNFVILNGVWANVPGISVTITPTSVLSTVLIQANIIGDRLAANPTFIRILRNGTPIGAGVGPGLSCKGWAFGNVFFTNVLHMDSPASVAALTYTFQVQVTGGNNTIYLNTDSLSHFSGVTTTVVQEIG
jgi:hypothetical protein